MKKAILGSICSMLICMSSFAFGVTAVTVAASCPNVHNGIIIVTPAGGVAPYTYSLNGGAMVSSSNTFTGLAAGNYSILVTDAMGDTGSTTVLIFVAGFLSSSSINVSICSNQLPYHFNDADIYVPGVYSDTLTNMTGCDSIVTLNLSIIPAESSSVNITICTSQVPYTWNGQNYNSSGVYTLTFPGSPCDSTATLNLTVSNTDVWLGTVNTSWEEPSNWSCGVVPGPLSDVIINSGTVVVHTSTTINSIILGASANLTVNPAVNFTVLH